METARKVYLSLNLLGFDISLGRTVEKKEEKKDFGFQKYATEIPVTDFFEPLTTGNLKVAQKAMRSLMKPRDVASLMVEKEVLDEGKRIYRKLGKKKSSSSYYKRKKIAEERRYKYKNNIGGLRDRILEAGRKHRDKLRREKAMAEARKPF